LVAKIETTFPIERMAAALFTSDVRLNFAAVRRN